jgi:hypothetical protein
MNLRKIIGSTGERKPQTFVAESGTLAHDRLWPDQGDGPTKPMPERIPEREAVPWRERLWRQLGSGAGQYDNGRQTSHGGQFI